MDETPFRKKGIAMQWKANVIVYTTLYYHYIRLLPSLLSVNRKKRTLNYLENEAKCKMIAIFLSKYGANEFLGFIRFADQPTNEHVQTIRGNCSICAAGNERTYFIVQTIPNSFTVELSDWHFLMKFISDRPKFFSVHTQKFDSWTKFQNAKIHNSFLVSLSALALALSFALALWHFIRLSHTKAYWKSTNFHLKWDENERENGNEEKVVCCCNLNSIHNGLKINFNWNASTSTYN